MLMNYFYDNDYKNMQTENGTVNIDLRTLSGFDTARSLLQTIN